MARLHEHEGKAILKIAKVPIPRGEVAATPAEVKKIAEKMGKPVVVKAQIWAGGRGKAGGIKVADTPAEAERVAGAILGAVIKGILVEKVLVEEKLDIAKEYYAGIIVDSSKDVRAPVVIFSTEGGMDIESVPEEKIARMNIDVLRGLRYYDALNLCVRAGVPSKVLPDVARIVAGLHWAFKEYGCRTAEINPMVITKEGKVLASDCRMSIDDSSVCRHPELGIDVAREAATLPTELDKIAWQIEESDLRGTAYIAQMVEEIKEPGYIGYHGMGGGGAILGVDALNRVGLKIANYADTSGNPPASKVYRAAKVILSQKGIEGYMLGGFMVANQEQWHHAHGVVKALREEIPRRPGFPAVLLLCGNKEKESLEILREGTKDLPGRIEIYGSEKVYETEFLARRLLALIEEYRRDRRK
ncbi:MAG: acetate--CoA ligase family protein [Syntrophales bacterium]|jgi:succinyl-CoA synthetase beta subunit|nr:acetate--CoA ligase family protein [Syntrophales bacterium]